MTAVAKGKTKPRRRRTEKDRLVEEKLEKCGKENDWRMEKWKSRLRTEDIR